MSYEEMVGRVEQAYRDRLAELQRERDEEAARRQAIVLERIELRAIASEWAKIIVENVKNAVQDASDGNGAAANA